MKRITLLFMLLVGIIITGCDKKNDILELPCENFFIENKDDFDKSVTYESRTVFFKESSDDVFAYMKFLSFNLRSFYINLHIVQPICVDDESKVIFLFEDGTTSENSVVGELNCDGSILIKGVLVSEFSFKTLDGFRIKTKDGYLDKYIDKESKLVLSKTAECFFKTANEKVKNNS